MEQLDDVAAVETPEQIELDLRLAGVGSRASAFLIDMLIQIVVILICVIALAAALSIDVAWSKEDRVNSRLPLVLSALFNAVAFGVNFLYFTFFDLVMRGQSPGKRAFKLRVVRASGHPIDARASLVRNLVRVADFLPAFYTLGLLMIFVDRRHRRLGDLAAGTLVVRQDPQAMSDLVPLDARTWAPWLTPAERELVEDFLNRADTLLIKLRIDIARDLANGLSRTHGLAPPDDAMTFLRGLRK